MVSIQYKRFLSWKRLDIKIYHTPLNELLLKIEGNSLTAVNKWLCTAAMHGNYWGQVKTTRNVIVLLQYFNEIKLKQTTLFHHDPRKIDATPLQHTKLLLNLYYGKKQRLRILPNFYVEKEEVIYNCRRCFSIIQNDKNQYDNECFLINLNGSRQNILCLFLQPSFLYMLIKHCRQSLFASLMLISAYFLRQAKLTRHRNQNPSLRDQSKHFLMENETLIVLFCFAIHVFCL